MAVDRFSVSVATVTYGDRGDLVRETVSRALRAGAEHVTVILNGASRRTGLMLAHFGSRVDLVDLGVNTGSAGGFAAALKALKQRPESHGLLLDDDNWINAASIESFRAAYREARELPSGENELVALAAFHAANTSQAAVVAGRTVRDSFPICTRGSIEGFDISNRIRAGSRNRRGAGAWAPDHHTAGLTEIPLAPYGGLFLSRAVLEICDDPRTDFVLYNDDYEFTRRLSRQGVRIYLVPEIHIQEADGKSQADPVESYLSTVVRTPPRERWRVLYRLRNATYLYREEARQSRSESRFGLNLLARLILVVLAGVRHRRFRFSIQVVIAHIDGFRGRLGVRYSLPTSTYVQSGSGPS